MNVGWRVFKEATIVELPLKVDVLFHKEVETLVLYRPTHFLLCVYKIKNGSIKNASLLGTLSKDVV